MQVYLHAHYAQSRRGKVSLSCAGPAEMNHIILVELRYVAQAHLRKRLAESRGRCPAEFYSISVHTRPRASNMLCRLLAEAISCEGPADLKQTAASNMQYLAPGSADVQV
jgi:hypothetical protein